MRILAAADIHGIFSVYEWLVEQSAKQQVEVLLLAGDLFAGGLEDEQRRQGKQIISILKMATIPAFYLMGNDDFVDLAYEDEQIRPLQGRRIEAGGLGFVGYQYTLPFVGGIFEKPEEEMDVDLKQVESLLDSQTVLVTHSPPHGILDRTCSGDHVGSRSLTALLQRKTVAVHVFGHIHESFGNEGRHFNVASAGQHRAYVIDLPSLQHEVVRAE